MTTKHDNSNNDIEESLYSRQLYTYGVEAMQKMKTAKILFSGLDGLGLEAVIAGHHPRAERRTWKIQSPVNTKYSITRRA